MASISTVLGVVLLGTVGSVLVATASRRPAQAPEPQQSVGTLSESLVSSGATLLSSTAVVEAPSPRQEAVSEKQVPENNGPAHREKRARNLDKVQQLLDAGSPAGQLLGIAVSCTADILESEGLRTQLQRGVEVRPGDFEDANLRAIIRQGPEGAFVLLAERDRFPLLDQLVHASQVDASVTAEQWQAALALAQEADLAIGR